MCGFESLSREEKVVRAHEILNSTEAKQAICHQILGTSFKDIEKAMSGVLKERQLSPELQEEIELKEMAPEKFEPEFDPEFEFRVRPNLSDRKTDSERRYLTREDVARLLAASKAPHVPEPQPAPAVYKTLSREVAERMVREHYEYIEEQKRKNREKL